MKSYAPAIAFALAVPSLVAHAPQSAPDEIRRLNLYSFLTEAGRANLDIAAARFNITVAEAQLAIERLFPDPGFSLGVSSIELYGPSKEGSVAQYNAGLGWTLELGGKRAARMDFANSMLSAATLEFEAFLLEWYFDAAVLFIDAQKAKWRCEELGKIHRGLLDKVALNEARYVADSTYEAELALSRMEARKYEAGVLLAEAEARVAHMALAQLMGPDTQPFALGGELNFPHPNIDHEQILAAALSRCPRLLAARQNIELANSGLRLAKANRWVDLGLHVGLSHTPTGPISGINHERSLMSNTLSAGISVPLPFSRRHKGELIQAGASLSQAKVELSSVELKKQYETLSALEQYEATLDAVKAFQKDVLSNSDKVLEASRLNYREGRISLMEFISTQQVCIEAHLSYIDARINYAKALAHLGKVAGGRVFGEWLSVDN